MMIRFDSVLSGPQDANLENNEYENFNYTDANNYQLRGDVSNVFTRAVSFTFDGTR